MNRLDLSGPRSSGSPKLHQPYNQYRSGVDVHLDWAISPVLTERLHIGAVGYVYDQLTGDSGAPPALGGFNPALPARAADRVLPSSREPDGYLNVRGYYEFNARNRLEGWTWVRHVLS